MKLPEVGGGEAAVGRKHRHEATGGVDVGALFEIEERLKSTGDAGVAERHAIGEAEGAHHEVVDGPRAESAQREERAFGAGGGESAERREVEGAVGDEAGERDDVIGFLAGELQGEKIAWIEGGDGGGGGRGDETMREACAGEFEKAALEEAGEGKINLLADDRPQQAVVNRGCAADTEVGAPGDQAGEAELAGEAGECGGVVVESEKRDNDGMSLDGGGRGMSAGGGSDFGEDFFG